MCARVRVKVCFSAHRELVTMASASLILSPADVPSFLTNHRGQPSGTLQSLLHIRSTHVPWKRTQVLALFVTVEPWGWKALGSQQGLSTCRKKVGLLSNAQLIKLWCVLLSRSSMCFCLFLPHLQPSDALAACPITLKLVFVLSRLNECFLLFFFSVKASALASKWPSPSVEEDVGDIEWINAIALMVFTCVCKFCCLASKVSRRSTGLESVCYIQSKEQSWDADGAGACHV